MKRFISVILLLVFLYNIGGYYIWFKLEQFNIKSDIRSEIKVKDLTIISVLPNGNSSIVWINSNKEFIYHGEMYDVVKTKTQNNIKYYYCINDKKEKQLIADFIKRQSSQKKSKNRLQKSTNKIYQIISSIRTGYNLPVNIKFFTLTNHYCSNIKDIHSPPPKVLIS